MTSSKTASSISAIGSSVQSTLRRPVVSETALVAIASSIVFGLGAHLRAVDAAYFTVTTMATVGYGDINLQHQPDWLKVYAICLMGTSVVLSAGLLAFIIGVPRIAPVDWRTRRAG